MDLKAFDSASIAEAGIDVEIVDPRDGQKTGIVFKVRGTDSATYRRALAEQSRGALDAKRALTLEELQDQGAILLSKMIAGWEGVRENGAPVPFSEAEALRIVKTYPEIRRQLDVAAQDRRRFFPTSPETSESAPGPQHA